MIRRQRYINYWDVASCMNIAETVSNVVFSAFEELRYEFDNVLKKEGISMYKKDPESETSVIYLVHGNTVTVYKSTIDTIIKLNRLGEYYQTKQELMDLIDSDIDISKILKNKQDTCYEDFNNNHNSSYLPYISTAYALYEAGTLDNMRTVLEDNLTRQMVALGYQRLENTNSITFMSTFMSNYYKIEFDKDFEGLYALSKTIRAGRLENELKVIELMDDVDF